MLTNQMYCCLDWFFNFKPCECICIYCNHLDLVFTYSFIFSRTAHTAIKGRFSDHTQNVEMMREGISVLIHFLNIVNQLPGAEAAAIAGIVYTMSMSISVVDIYKLIMYIDIRTTVFLDTTLGNLSK